jgi:hypothetical protein
MRYWRVGSYEPSNFNANVSDFVELNCTLENNETVDFAPSVVSNVRLTYRGYKWVMPS